MNSSFLIPTACAHCKNNSPLWQDFNDENPFGGDSLLSLAQQPLQIIFCRQEIRLFIDNLLP